MNEFRSNFAETVARAEQLARQVWTVMESFAGGMVDNINQLSTNFTLAKMKVMATLAFVIGVSSACSPENTPSTPESPLPTEAPASEVTTQEISQLPVGFGETPGPDAVATSTAVPTEVANPGVETTGPREFFTVPESKGPIEFGVESPIPSSLRETVDAYKTAMNKIKGEVAEVCAIPDADNLVPTFKSNDLAGDDYRWTVVFESPKDRATCWSSVASTGSMGDRPIYFEYSGGQVEVLSSSRGGGWERMDEAVMDFAGTQPVARFNDGYLQPEGLTLGSMYSEILPYGEAPREIQPSESPFSAASMEIITNAGWHWENSTGTLNDPNNNEILQYQGDILYDGEGNQFELEGLKILGVNGIDEYGEPMKLILERTVSDEQGEYTEIYVQKTNEWRSTRGYEPGKTSETDIMKWNHITQEDVESGFLRTLILSNQYKWPENSVTPVYTYAFMGGSRDGAFELTVSGMDSLREYPELSEGGQLAIAQPLMYRMDKPGSTEQVAIAVELRKAPGGGDLVLVSAISGYYVPGTTLDNEFGVNGNSTGITYLVGLDDRDCSQVDLGNGSASGSRVVSDICGFMPPEDPRWDIATWDSIANGAEPGSVYESVSLTDKDLSAWQDSIMLGLGKFD